MLLSVADTILTMHLLKCGLGYKCLPRICNLGGELSVYIVILIFFFFKHALLTVLIIYLCKYQLHQKMKKLYSMYSCIPFTYLHNEFAKSSEICIG